MLLSFCVHCTRHSQCILVFSLCAHLCFFCVHGTSFRDEQLFLFGVFRCVLFLCNPSVLFLNMSTQAPSAQHSTQEIRDQPHHGGWRWDATGRRWMSRVELVSTSVALAWTGAVSSTLEATLINEGKKDGAFAKLRHCGIMNCCLSVRVYVSLQDRDTRRRNELSATRLRLLKNRIKM